MVLSSDQLRDKILSSETFRELERQRYYLQYYRQEYADFEDLLALIVDREIEMAPRCPERLTSDSYATGTYSAYTPTEHEYFDICNAAREKGITQIQEYYDRYPALALESWFIRRTIGEAPYIVGEETTGEHERLAARQRAANEFYRHARLGRAVRRGEPVPEGLTSEEREHGEEVEPQRPTPRQVEINREILKLMRANEALEMQLDEYIRTHPLDVAGIKKMQDQLLARDREIERLQGQAAHGVETISEDLTGTEAQYVKTHIRELDRTMYNLEPTDTGWRLTVQVKDEGEKVLVDNLLREAEKYDREQKEKRKVAGKPERVSGYLFVADELCQVYRTETGKTCAMSRPLIENLANDMLKYLYDNRLIKDAQEYDWLNEVQLFAEKGQPIYKREQAEEAYRDFIAKVNVAITGQRRPASQEADFCTPEYTMSAFYWLVLESHLIKMKLEPLKSQAKRIADSRALLKDCGYADSMFARYLDEARDFFAQQGLDLDKDIEVDIENARRGEA